MGSVSVNEVAGPGVRLSVRELAQTSVIQFGDGYRTRRDELGPTGMPILRVAQIMDGHVQSIEDLDHVRDEFRPAVGAKLSRPGDVVLTTKGTFGRRALMTERDVGYAYSPQVCWFRVQDRERLVPRYLYYWLGSRDFHEQALGMTSQTDMADYLSLRDLSRIQVPVPPIREQQATADILGAFDDKIELNRRTSEMLESIAQALFKSWFVDFDPVRAKAEGLSSELPEALQRLLPNAIAYLDDVEVPDGWDVRGLDGIARFLNGLAMQRFPAGDGPSLPVIKIAQLRAGNTLNADRASAALDPDYVVRDGDVLFSWSGSLECVVWAGGKGALNQHLFKVTSEEYPDWFYYHWVHQHLPGFRKIAAGKATTMGHINRHHLSDAPVVVPPEGVLNALSPLFQSLLEATWRRKVESRTLAEIRDALLPRLVSGALRVPEAERIAVEAGA